MSEPPQKRPRITTEHATRRLRRYLSLRSEQPPIYVTVDLSRPNSASYKVYCEVGDWVEAGMASTRREAYRQAGARMFERLLQRDCAASAAEQSLSTSNETSSLNSQTVHSESGHESRIVSESSHESRIVSESGHESRIVSESGQEGRIVSESGQESRIVSCDKSTTTDNTETTAIVAGGRCPICLNAQWNTVLVPCGHTFCDGCLVNIMQADYDTWKCPVCRWSFTRAQSLFF